MWSINLFTISLRENGGTNRLWYKITDELRVIGINNYFHYNIPEIENMQHIIKESCFMRDVKK
jgi:hypothetical protein